LLIETLGVEVIGNYRKHLETMGSLSGLSSESESPYINSRVIENIFCLVTDADNLGRSDCSADAKLGEVGIGIKTFLANNNNSMQKIAEFNKDASMIRNKVPDEIVGIISNLRNERILSTMRIYAIKRMIYHCVVREPNLIKICEQPMDIIDIENIVDIEVKSKGRIIYFNDGINEYSFNLNKNTLFKRFDTSKSIFSVKVKILKEPFVLLSRFLNYGIDNGKESQAESYPSIILPLFSNIGGRNVPKRSGLNQWNASGRPRDNDEIYIPIPAWIHKVFPEFLPERYESFVLRLPNGNQISAKVCQDGKKALMSNPNLELGKWLLREVMNLKERELLTYNKLQILGIDSVEVYKIDSSTYKIDFRPIGSYDKFLEENK